MFDDFDDDDDEWCGDCGKCEDCLETAMDVCGKISDGSCSMAGTEQCDWECPFSLDSDADDDAICRRCGCSDSIACENGCYWIEDDLCSECVGK